MVLADYITLANAAESAGQNVIIKLGCGCVAQLVERSLPIPEVRDSNPVIGKNFYYYRTFVYCQLCIEKMKIKKKEAGNGPFLKKRKKKIPKN